MVGLMRRFTAITGLFLVGICAFVAFVPLVYAEDIQVVCPKSPPPIPKISRKETYTGVPFKAREAATYEVSWAGLKAGYGTLEVRPPIKHRGRWHRVFHVEASTGDWFKAVFVAKEKVEALSQPWDFGIAKFFMQQREGKLFSQPFMQKKWLEFEHERCKVHERIVKPEQKEVRETFDLHYGAIDALGAVYKMRTLDYRIGRKERAPIYTSQKNWWLEIDPIKKESIKVPAGTFLTTKLKLQTFLGKELQQKGDVFLWIATDGAKPLVQIQGDIKIGSVWAKLHKFKPGR